MNIYEYALKMELDGKAFYQNQAESTNNAGLRTIFLRLAEDEEKHYQTIKAIQRSSPPGPLAQSTALDDAKNVFEKLTSSGVPQPLADSDLEAYQEAMDIEQKSAQLYQNAAEEEEDTVVQKTLLQIAEEEKSHFEILENIFNFVNAPNQYLAWGEFSNLEEFHNFGRNVDLSDDK